MEGHVCATSRRRSGSMETGELDPCSVAARGLQQAPVGWGAVGAVPLGAVGGALWP